MSAGEDPFALALAAWKARAPAEKCALAARIADSLAAGAAGLPPPFDEPGSPGRPTAPLLVAPRDLPRRSLGSPEGRAAFVHAICHIEFSAINLALDAALRFPGLPEDYYRDWLRVATEEARHFALLSAHLERAGARYGDFAAHGGLWDMAEKTRHDPLERMALVPRVLEARGLDVTPDMILRLRAAGDDAGAGILETILHDEIGHVAIGSRWFSYLCGLRALDPEATFLQLAGALGGGPGGSLNEAARLAAGFSPGELATLAGARAGTA